MNDPQNNVEEEPPIGNKHLRSAQRLRLRQAVLVIGFCILHADCGLAVGDERVTPRSNSDQVVNGLIDWAELDPSAALVSRVRAQAELMRFQRNRSKAFRALNNINDMQMQIEEHDVRQVAGLRHLNANAWKNHRAWQRLKNNPDLSEAAIRNGRALDFLLTRLAVTALPYRFDPADTRYSSGVLAELRVEPDVFENLTLHQRYVSFPATAMKGATIAYWPYILRWEEFSKPRTAYENARERVVKEAEQEGGASVDSIMAMQLALDRFSAAFKNSSTPRQWAIANGRTLQFGQCNDFFVDLNREMKRLEQTGDLRPFQSRDDYNPAKDGDHLVNLLSFMNRNGIRFSKAKPGSEFAYHSLFNLMRALYLTVEDADESTRVQTIEDQAKEAMERDAKISPQKERLTSPQ